MSEQHDRRKHPRYPVQGFVLIVPVDEKDVRSAVEGDTTNISEGGVFVRIDERFTPGTPVELRITLTDEPEPLRIIGIVRWQREEEPTGIGVEIVEAFEEDRGVSTKTGRRPPFFVNNPLPHVVS